MSGDPIHVFSICLYLASMDPLFLILSQLSLERRKERRQHPPQPPPKWHLTHSSFMLFIHPWPLISRSPVFTNNNSSDYSLDCNSTENHPLTCLSSLRLLTSAEHYRPLQIDPSFHTVYVKKHPATGLHSDICPLHSCPKCPTAKRPERIPAKTAPVTDY